MHTHYTLHTVPNNRKPVGYWYADFFGSFFTQIVLIYLYLLNSNVINDKGLECVLNDHSSKQSLAPKVSLVNHNCCVKYENNYWCWTNVLAKGARKRQLSAWLSLVATASCLPHSSWLRAGNMTPAITRRCTGVPRQIGLTPHAFRWCTSQLHNFTCETRLRPFSREWI